MSDDLFDWDKPSKDYYGGYTVASLYRLIREFSVVHKGMIKRYWNWVLSAHLSWPLHNLTQIILLIIGSDCPTTDVLRDLELLVQKEPLRSHRVGYLH